jgi:putative ABC transport system permease protein
VSFSVLRRRREIGRLRAVGAPRRLVFALFLAEAAALAAPGVAAGVFAGRALSSLAVGATAGTIDRFFIAEAVVQSVVATPVPGLAEWGLAFGVALPLCLAAAAWPALEAARVAPAAGARESPLGPRSTTSVSRQLAWAAALGAVALGLCQLDPPGDVPVYGTAAAGVLIAAIGALASPALQAAVATGRRFLPGGLLGYPATVLALANLRAASARLAITVTALAASVGMAVAIAVLVGSFRETVSVWLHKSLAGDIYFRAASGGGSGGPAVDPAAVALIRADPDIASVEGIRQRDIEFAGSVVTLAVGDIRQAAANSRFDLKACDAGLRAGDWGSMVGVGGGGRLRALVSESFALRFDNRVGDTVNLPAPSGSVPLLVSGVYYDYSSTRGVVWVDRETWLAAFATPGEAAAPGWDALVAFVRAGTPADAVKARLDRALSGAGYRLVSNTTGGVLAASIDIFDDTFAVTTALKAVAVAVAGLGVVSALMTLLLERTRDTALFRLLGARARDIRHSVLIEAAVIGSVSFALGTASGLLLAAVLVFVINVQSFGWTIRFDIPWLWVAQCGALVLLGAAAAAAWPARRATRILPAQAARDIT